MHKQVKGLYELTPVQYAIANDMTFWLHFTSLTGPHL